FETAAKERHHAVHLLSVVDALALLNAPPEDVNRRVSRDGGSTASQAKVPLVFSTMDALQNLLEGDLHQILKLGVFGPQDPQNAALDGLMTAIVERHGRLRMSGENPARDVSVAWWRSNLNARESDHFPDCF